MVFCVQLNHQPHVFICVCNLYPSAATSTHIKPTGYHHVTTATTTIVETPLDSRAQPVATEHAVPSSTQFSTLSFVIGMCTDVFEAQTSISAYTTITQRATMSSELHLLRFGKAGALTF